MYAFRKMRRFYFSNKHLINIFSLCFLLLCLVLIQMNVICVNFQALRHANRMCNLHRQGRLLGALCQPLCGKEIHSLSCHPVSFKEAVFSAYWQDNHLVFKKISSSSFTDLPPNQSESTFLSSINELLKTKLNLTASLDELKSLSHMKAVPHYTIFRETEMQELWLLLQNREYLMLAVFAHRDIFPKLLGNCGLYYAIEYVEPIKELDSWNLDDSKDAWRRKIKMALMILEAVDEMETGFHEVFELCDIRLQHFGIHRGRTANRMKIIDLNLVYPKSILDELLTAEDCTKDDDCDFKDCHSSCVKSKCTSRKNDNLQVVCEKIFLGWRMSNRVLVPGLLMSEHTPAELAYLLRHCANPYEETGKIRAAASREVSRRLMNLLIEMDQSYDADGKALYGFPRNLKQ